ncbi:MAG TPA: Zn-ribbon domain-containing OB-fold protein [Hadesarchaea archaeon]|nr:Zn-ribbon domain-containing OB-fold protein [Hadesarchaea archaeon]
MAAPRFWREIPSRYNLIGTRCGNCNQVHFPPRYLCPQCRRVGKLEPYKLKPRGRVVSYTVIHVAAEGFEDQVPYVLAIVELKDGPHITAQVTDCKPDEVKVGDEMEIVFRRMGQEGEEGVLHYGYKCKKID